MRRGGSREEEGRKGEKGLILSVCMVSVCMVFQVPTYLLQFTTSN